MSLHLDNIEVISPPEHTQIKPRCFDCANWEICRIKDDYLKTVTLIQNILGDP